MNRKKITKTTLTGLVAVTMLPAFAAPLGVHAEEGEESAPVVNEGTTGSTANENPSAPVENEEHPVATEEEETVKLTEGAPNVPEDEGEATLRVTATTILAIYPDNSDGIPYMAGAYQEEFKEIGKLGEKHKFEVTLTPPEGYVLVKGDSYITDEVEYGKDKLNISDVVYVKADIADEYMRREGITTNQPVNDNNVEKKPAKLTINYVDAAKGFIYDHLVSKEIYDDKVGPEFEYATYDVKLNVPEGYELDSDPNISKAYDKEQMLHRSVMYGSEDMVTIVVKPVAGKSGNQTDDKNANTQKDDVKNVSAKKDSKAQSKGVDTAVATPLAGIFGTMSTALAGMVVLLRRKQK